MKLDRVAQRWHELSALYEHAVNIPDDQIDAYCDSVCSADEELRDLLSSLLRHIGDVGSVEDSLRKAVSQVVEQASTFNSLLGMSVGAYKVERELGRGGMGAVYLASRADGEFQKHVAIKVMRGEWAGETMAALFRTERQVLANLNHPSIPSLADSGQLDDGRSYFICDYIDGVSLDAHCTGSALSLDDRLDLLCTVGSAVQHAHNNLVLHLDIKPANILVEPNGEASLLDFGVARLIGELDSDHRAFSPGYASPEQIEGGNLTAASDVYSLGALLFFVLTGKDPFALDRQAPTKTALLKQAEFLAGLRDQRDQADIDVDLQCIVREAMAEDPADRYATVDAMLRDIDKYRQHYPIGARHYSVGRRMLMFVRRNRLATCVATGILIAIAGFGLREHQLRQTAQTAEQAAVKVSDFLTDVFQVMDPSQSRGSTVTARELLDSAVERIPIELAQQPDVAARVLHAMSGTYASLGLYDQATKMMENALALGNERAGAAFTPAVEAQLLTALGRQYANAGRLHDARRVLEENVATIERDLGSDSEELVNALSSLGNVYSKHQDFGEARSVHERALSRADVLFGPGSPKVVPVLYDLDTYYQTVGDMAPREDLLRRIVEIETDAFGAEHLKVARAVSRLAMYYVEVTQPELALTTHERAHQLALAALGPDHPEMALYKQRLGVTYRNMGQFELAEAQILEGLRIEEQTLGMTHPAVGASLSILGSLYNSMGRRTEALTHLHRSLDIMRTYHPEDNSNVGYQKMALGEVYRVTGDLAQAERYTIESIDTLRSVNTQIDFALDGEWQLANIFRDQGRYAQALPIYERLFAWHQANPSLDEEHMLEVTNDFRQLLRLMGDETRAKRIGVPVVNNAVPREPGSR